MPGREDLIQQNIERARTNAAAPRPQESSGKAPSSIVAGNRSVNFFGGNYEVYSQLESIAFADKYGDYSMRGSVAYIRIWKRGGTAVQSTTTTNTNAGGSFSSTSSFSLDPNSQFSADQFFYNTDLNLKLSESIGKYGFSIPPEVYDDTVNYQFPSSQLFTNFSPFFNGRQQSTSTQTPTNQPTEQRPGIVVGPSPFPQRPATYPYFQSPRAFGPIPFSIPSQPLGPVVPGNPNGLLTLLGNIGIGAALGGLGFRGSYPSYLQGPRLPPPPYLGGARATPQGNTILPLGTGVWQFLFNPSEMELDIGPEFKSAETWGVSDKANSGQPLHWSHNKNAELKFNSVLLNGYVFGRKVETLEQGLIELFMMRDGPGQHGPHVLEFVWGKRTFGPCVIKNINIKEKMWDEGELVNAELSFTLEQVPEWTINDGAYVDVARPGRRPLQEEAANFAQPSTASADQSSQPPPPTSGGGDSSSQKPPTTPADPNANLNLRKKCTNLRNTISNLDKIKSSPNFFGISQENPVQAQERLRKYKYLYNYATLNQITPINVGRATPDNIEKVINLQWDRNSQGQTRPGRLQTRYPTSSANSTISEGVSFLMGNLQTQVNSSTCSEALK